MSTAPTPSATPPSPSSSSSSPPPSTPTLTSPPPSTPSAPPPNTTPSAPPPSAPPPATPSAPPPSTPSAPPPSFPSAPPPAVPSAPPPSTPSAPPPAVPSAPPPTTVPTSPPPPQSAPTPPSPPGTPSRPPPLSPPSTPSRPPPLSPPVSGGTPSPPAPRTPPSSKTPPPPPSGTSSSSSSISTPVIIGLVAGAAVLLLAVLCLCCTLKRKKRRDPRRPPPRPSSGDIYAAAAPTPPPPTWAKQQKDDFAGHPQTWHQNAPPPRDHAITVPTPNSPRPVYASRPPLPGPPVLTSSGGSGSGSIYSASQNPLPPPPGLALGFLKSTFTFEELEQATDGFSEANLLGKGGFGYVHKGVLPNGQEVAVKQLKTGSGQGDREFHAEVEIIGRVHHKHLVSLVGYCITGDRRLLVYEFVPNNTLEFHLHGKEPQTIEWPARLKIALGSAKGLAYLHEDCHPKIIHRDIKASNILLDFKFEAKVSDFGLAKFTSDNNTHVSTRVMGTFGYLAPEYASSGKLTEKSDIFSFGVMLLELITGRRPVDATSAFMEDSLVDWARPLLSQALEDGNFSMLADPRLQNYNVKEMVRMVACAAACIHYSARRRPRMSQVVRVLEGDSSFEILNEGLVPGHSPKYSSYSSSEYDVGQYNEDMKRFRKLALSSQEYASSDYPTSEYGQNPSASSSEAVTREMDVGNINKNSDEQR